MQDENQKPQHDLQPTLPQSGFGKARKVILPLSSNLASPEQSTPASPEVNSQPAPTPQTSNENINPGPVTQMQQPTPTETDYRNIVGSQLPPEKKSYKKLIIKCLSGVAAIGVVFVVLVFLNIISLSEFKTVNYDNGKGSTFKLEFYNKHTVKNVNQSAPTTSGTSVSPNLKELVSKVSANGKSPLTLWIESSNSTSSSFTNNDCTRNNLPKAFDAKVDYINSNVAVCAIRAQNIDIIYLVTFHDEKNSYIVFIAQDIDFRKALSSQQDAKDALAKAGLSDYQDDIQTILASIKPVN